MNKFTYIQKLVEDCNELLTFEVFCRYSIVVFSKCQINTLKTKYYFIDVSFTYDNEIHQIIQILYLQLNFAWNKRTRKSTK